MTEFWKRPKFWISAIIILWLGYLLTANLSEPVEIYIVPHFLHRTVTAAAVMIVAAMIGCLLTLVIQFSWRKRSSKNAVASPATPVSSSSTVA
jgi:TRAP-type C4-dicarboxylate transport system permease small subunit